ncbi:MAG: MGMT family protein [bacterium]
MPSEWYQKIYEIIQRIPKGKVATYGQIAALAGKPGAARVTGWVLHALPADSDTPWHRVLNASGKSSLPQKMNRQLQRALLSAEGVIFDQQGRVDLNKFQWDGR